MIGQTSLDEWIRQAYRGEEGCPPPGAYLAEELATLDVKARERLESHAESCAACAAERDLAMAFEASGSDRASDRRQIERIARRLERRPPHDRRSGWRAWAPSWEWIAHRPAFQLAAAAILVIAVGVGVRNASGPPPLGAGPGDSATRSSALAVEAPVGEIAEAPGGFAWQAVEEASSYVVTVRGVDDTELWRVETAEAGVAVDDNLAGQLRPAVWYVWNVEALDGAGRRIAWSPEARFRISPSGEEP